MIVFGKPAPLDIAIIAACDTESKALDTSNKYIFKGFKFCSCLYIIFFNKKICLTILSLLINAFLRVSKSIVFSIRLASMK